MTAEVSRPPGLLAEGVAGIALRFGNAAKSWADLDSTARRERLARELYQTPVAPPQIPVTSGAGLLQPTDLLGPMTGQYWSVRRLVSYGYSAGTVSVLRNGTATGYGASAAAVGEILFTFPQAGTYTFGRGEVLLRPDDNLLFLATGITLSSGYAGIQVYGDADCFASYLLPEYIG